MTLVLEPTRAMEDAFDRLALLHGSISIELCLRDGAVSAYVRAPTGERYDVNDWGREKRRLNNDLSPYEESA